MTDETPGFTVKQRGPSSARADFVCLGKACQTKKGARRYELPVNATHCPMGHKRLQRIYTPPHIARGVAKASDALIGPEYDKRRQQKDKAEFPRKFPTMAAERGEQAPMLAVPNDGNLASAVSRALGMPVAGNFGSPGKAKPTLGITSPDLAGVKAAGATGVRPTTVKRWNPTADDIAAARRAT